MPRRAKPPRSPWKQGPPAKSRVGNAHLSKKVTPRFFAARILFFPSYHPQPHDICARVESTLWRIHLNNRIPIEQRVAPSRLPSPRVDDHARCQFTFVLRPSRFQLRSEPSVTTKTVEDGSSVSFAPLPGVVPFCHLVPSRATPRAIRIARCCDRGWILYLPCLPSHTAAFAHSVAFLFLVSSQGRANSACQLDYIKRLSNPTSNPNPHPKKFRRGRVHPSDAARTFHHPIMHHRERRTRLQRVAAAV